MKTEDIDKIIEQSLAENRKQSRWNRSRHDSDVRIRQIRNILNTVFMIGFVAAVVIYFAMPSHRVLFFSVGFGAMILKIIEFVLRFTR